MENPSARKAARMNDIELLLLAHPQGLAPGEIAERLGVDKSTISRYKPDLPKHIYVDDLDGGKWKVDKQAYLINVRFNLHEALAIHLAARLLTTRIDRQNPHAASALRKLGNALERLAPHISRHMLQSAEVMETGQRKDLDYLHVLEGLSLAWAEGRKLRVWHRAEADGKLIAYIFSPYFIEPYAVGQSTHVIGLREPPGKVRTFKVERIERVEPLGEHYEIPADFDPSSLLADAWGIWYTEAEPVEVVLKFGRGAAGRVKESRWHRSEEVEEQEDGSLIWRAKIAEPRELLPWIRGWGADVEVLEPEALRNVHKREVQRMARVYQVEIQQYIPNYFHLHAKWEENQFPDIHPLIYHLLDVGQTTLSLWNNVLSEQTKAIFSEYLGLDGQTTGLQLAFWASLHDLGKAAPVFQRRYTPRVSALEKVGFIFPPQSQLSPNPAPHGVLTTWAVKDLLIHETGLKPRDAYHIAVALGGHHGTWPTSDRLMPSVLKSSDKGDASWDDVRKSLLQILKEVYRPRDGLQLPGQQVDRNTFLTLFSGLVSVADWIGSMTEYFPFMEEFLPANEYAIHADRQASAALQKLGWLGWRADGSLLSFATMFPHIQTQNDIQHKAFETLRGCTLPALVILEAPTGCGKTETALYLADTWLQKQKGRGIYIAMPTQATSNQMFGRVVNFLKNRYPQQLINIHLVHGAALLEEGEETPPPQGIALDERSFEGGVKAETWFLPRKRTLLAPFGVGTVDQALMGILQTNHFFVRIFGLGQKVVIFDEVHAYDTYMSTLFQRLLRWLRSIGTSVILLSATLPEKTRNEFSAAWLGDDISLPQAPYPRLTVLSGDNSDSVSLPSPQEHVLELDWQPATPQEISLALAEKLSGGGCAAVICNRVRRAQEVYQALQLMGIVESDYLILFHARFPFEWRKNIEDRVLSLFSKNGARPRKAIVVATQVIEQSLDLDFDYMVTDLAPLDLLLQRAGRLHRHASNDQNRPLPLKKPTLAIALPEEKNGLPEFGLDAMVYEKSILLRTWLALRGREQLTLPLETSPLIESVYGDGMDMNNIPDIFQAALRDASQKARQENDREIYNAKQRRVTSPDDEGLLNDSNAGLEEDNPAVHEAFRALTRLADPSVSLICLHQTESGIALEPDGTGAPLDLERRPNIELARELLRRAVSVQRREVVDYFSAPGRTTAEWKKSASVRYHYPVVFDRNGECRLPGADFVLKLSRELGLEVFKEEK